MAEISDYSARQIGLAVTVALAIVTGLLAMSLDDVAYAAVSLPLVYAICAILIWVYRPGLYNRIRLALVAIGMGIFVIGAAVELFLPGSPIEALFGVLNVSMAEAAVRISVPIALAGIGGLYAEKSGVFNIGLEGFLIFGAFTSIATAYVVAGDGGVTQSDLWIGLAVSMFVTASLAAIFAVTVITFKANQIVAGLAVWFIGLGFGPYGASVIWGNINSPPVGTINEVSIPVLSSIPYVGPVIFETNPMVLFTLVTVVALWYVLYYTKYGYWVQAAGENPRALDTAGIDVNRIRYSTVTLSGLLCGLGGSMLSIGVSAQFIGQGATMVNGRGWIGITAYMFGSYNPIKTFLAALLFGGVDAFQIRVQNLGFGIPSNIIELFPFVAVLVVLTVIGSSKIPSAAGEAYETEED